MRKRLIPLDLKLFPLGNVPSEAEDPSAKTLPVADIGLNRPDRAIPGPEQCLEQVASFLKDLRDVTRDLLRILLSFDVRDTHSPQFLAVIARATREGVVYFQKVALRVSHEERIGRGLDHGAVAGLALAQSLFRTLALCDVADEGEGASAGTRPAAHIDLNRKYGAVLLSVQRLEACVLFALDLAEFGGDLVGVLLGLDVGDTHSQQFLAAITQESDVGVVHLHEAAFRIGNRETVKRGLDESAVPGLSLAQCLFGSFPQSNIAIGCAAAKHPPVVAVDWRKHGRSIASLLGD